MLLLTSDAGIVPPRTAVHSLPAIWEHFCDRETYLFQQVRQSCADPDGDVAFSDAQAARIEPLFNKSFATHSLAEASGHGIFDAGSLRKYSRRMSRCRAGGDRVWTSAV